MLKKRAIVPHCFMYFLHVVHKSFPPMSGVAELAGDAKFAPFTFPKM